MQIAIPLYDRFTALDAIGPYEVLSRLPGARVTFVGDRGRPLQDRQRHAHDPGRGLARRPPAPGDPLRAGRLGHARRDVRRAPRRTGSATRTRPASGPPRSAPARCCWAPRACSRASTRRRHWLELETLRRDGRHARPSAASSSRARSSPPPASRRGSTWRCPAGEDRRRRVRPDDPAPDRVRPPAAVRRRLDQRRRRRRSSSSCGSWPRRAPEAGSYRNVLALAAVGRDLVHDPVAGRRGGASRSARTARPPSRGGSRRGRRRAGRARARPAPASAPRRRPRSGRGCRPGGQVGRGDAARLAESGGEVAAAEHGRDRGCGLAHDRHREHRRGPQAERAVGVEQRGGEEARAGGQLGDRVLGRGAVQAAGAASVHELEVGQLRHGRHDRGPPRRGSRAPSGAAATRSPGPGGACRAGGRRARRCGPRRPSGPTRRSRGRATDLPRQLGRLARRADRRALRPDLQPARRAASSRRRARSPRGSARCRRRPPPRSGRGARPSRPSAPAPSPGRSSVSRASSRDRRAVRGRIADHEVVEALARRATGVSGSV